ncbi:MAG: cadmium-translocating P-type ATPase [Prevotella sp.]|nr:cadmium-translocating P-type ATPase [Prevotella sp.]
MEEEERNFLKPAISLVLLIAGIVMTYMQVGWFSNKWVMLVWYVVAYLPVGIGVIKEAIESAVKGDVFSEFMLMSVASIGAFAIGEYPEAVAVMLFYCIGETLQDMAVDKARDNIKSLVAFRPDKAMVVKGNTVVEKTPDDVKIGEVIEVKPGERVALDGELLSGDASFNTAALTGESVPQMIEKGGEVLAGMIATDRVVRIRVKRIAGESAVARILNMVEEASSRKAQAELFIRKFARVYTPIVILLAVVTVVFPYFFAQVNAHFDYSFTKWFYRGLIFLVISCPCALVISIPLSYFAGIGAASKRGILFKGSNYLDAVKYIDTVVFDKTGTLTKGVFSVVKVDSKDEPDLLEIVAAIEKNSNHPIAKAIVAQSKDKDIAVTDVKDRPGNGLSAKVGDDNWLIGTLRQLDREYITYPDELTEVPETIVACAKNKKFVGYILLADTVKDDAKQAIKDLRKLDIKHIEILSGDKQALVTKLANELGVDAGYGDLMPEVKVKHVEMLKNEERDLAFVGDGINDAPVIAASFVGIAMGGLGSDMAIETADIVIQNDQPSKVVTAIKIGRRTHRIVNQNIIFAIGVKILVMALGVFGIANLWEAVFADVGVALLAVLNAMRIFFSKN